MKWMLYIRLSLLMWILLCDSFILEGLTAYQDSLCTGVLIDTVSCISDPDQSYALILPSGYDPGMSWPVVFIFEPGARGSMAASIFSEASERFGLIVMASNNSSNRSYAGSRSAAASMFKDARLRYNVDSTNLFVAGFSGGSRVASNLAIEHPIIKGVIGCGAGMYHNKNTHPEFRNSFFYYGIIGRRDINLIDMMDTEERLSQMHVCNHIQYTDIQHVWPPAEEISAAIAWLRYRIDTTDYDARNYFLAFQTREVQCMREEGLYLDAVSRIQSVDEVFHDSVLHEQKNLLMDDKVFRKQLRKRNRALELELKLKPKYLKALYIANLWMMIPPDQSWSWWNVAAVYARMGERAKAIELIELMVLSGNIRYEWFLDAADFESLLIEPEYIRLMNVLKEAASQ